jgi:predicted CxxxxCH...CXXCH cytochrome family protein
LLFSGGFIRRGGAFVGGSCRATDGSVREVLVSRRLLAALVPAALLACGVAQTNVSGVDAAAACTSCHGDPSRPGDALARAAPPVSATGAPAGAHLAHLGRGVACGSCHVVPTSSGHSNGVVEVRFSGLATSDGASPAFAGGTCSGVYCHGATLGAGGKVTTPAWTGGPLACDACHGAPPPSHAATSTSCHDCHPGTVKADGTIDVAGGLHVNGQVEASGGHPQGWADPAQHGAAAKQGLASCRSCHGADLLGGTTGVSCDSCHAAAGYPGWQSNCTFCHGTKLTAYDPSLLASAAPPRGTAGETATTDVAVGAHQRHLAGGAIGPAVACATCHVVPSDLAHVNGTVTVTFGPAATRGGASPVWNGASCASTYCHGATLAAGGTNQAPSWTGGFSQAACGTCHGAPPSTGHHSTHSGRSCGDCHPGYGTTTVNRATHVNGTKEVGNDITAWNPTTRVCTGCHGQATW